VHPARNPGPRKVIAKNEESVKLFAQAAPWQRVWLLLCSQLALRNAEARSISQANYDAHDGTITFRKKGGDDHVLPVTPEIMAVFEAAPAAPEGCEEWTYVDRWRGKKMSKAAIEHQWRKLKKACGVRETLRVHDLRRTTAVAFYELTKDLRAVSHLLGHTSMSATASYLANRDPQTLRPLLAQLKMPTQVKQ